MVGNILFAKTLSYTKNIRGSIAATIWFVGLSVAFSEMQCFDCQKTFEDDWSYCPRCGIKIDKKGCKEKEGVQKKLELRRNTLKVLQQIIDDLEYYGKMQKLSSMVSSGAKIASGVLWMVAPSNPFTVAADMTASGLSLADSGVSVFTVWKESGLLLRADKICKHDISMPDNKKKFPQPEEYKYKLSEGDPNMSILSNLTAFISNSIKLYNGNYSSVAAKLKKHLQGLQDEYDSLKKLA